MVEQFLDDVVAPGYVDNWLAIFVTREIESRVATKGFLLVLDVEWEFYVLPITTVLGHAAGLEVWVHSTHFFC